MSKMATQITDVSFVCSIVCSGPDERKHQRSPSLAFGWFPSQKASNTDNVSIWWHHHLFSLHQHINVWMTKWKHFPRYWPFVRGINRSSVNSPYKGQWRGVLMFSLICAWISGWVNNGEAGDLRRHRVHYDVTVMVSVHNNTQESPTRAYTMACTVYCYYGTPRD